MLSPNLLDYVGCVAELHAVDIRDSNKARPIIYWLVVTCIVIVAKGP